MHHITLFFALITLTLPINAQFRVYPYLLAPSASSMRINWFTASEEAGKLSLWKTGSQDTLTYQSIPVLMPELSYSELELSEQKDFPDMFENRNVKHTILLEGLGANGQYRYVIDQGEERAEGTFHTAPSVGATSAIRFITFADSETDPAGREIHRKWAVGNQHPSSTGRPDSLAHYLLTETEGYTANLSEIKKIQPDMLLISGDLVQGGGYQRAWDEFFFHNAGTFDTLLSRIPLLPAIGNWENFGARNGGYEPEAIAASRAKYKAYFDAPPNNDPRYQNFYYRIDYGPLTILTLDSSNGLPDSTDGDTNININNSTYPNDDLPDIQKGSPQWNWTQAQLKDARRKGQLIFVQFHHIPYSSGGHSLPTTAEGSTGQAGIPMRIYQPLFKQYGVVAVFCGHNESLEHSVVEGIHYWDVGIAGDGLGYSIDHIDPRRTNPYRQFVAHVDAPEHWQGKRLIDGGKHYGHLMVDILPEDDAYLIEMTPYYIFPLTNAQGQVTGTEKRAYDHVVTMRVSP